MSQEDKIKGIKEAAVCWSCLDVGHICGDYRNKSMCSENYCRKTHHLLTDDVSGHTSKLSSLNTNCLLQIMSIISHKLEKKNSMFYGMGDQL